MERILVIDDDRALCQLLSEYLTKEGFEVESAQDGQEGLERACRSEYALVVLDVVLPTMNGLDVLYQLRRESFVPVIVLTGCGEPVDRIVGLESGADDYMAKPFDLRELLARIRAVLRRTRHGRQEQQSQVRSPNLEVGDVVLDAGARLVFTAGRQIDLTSVEFSLLEILLRRAGRFVAREELILAVLGRSPYPCDRSIDVHISKLRKKLGEKWVAWSEFEP